MIYLFLANGFEEIEAITTLDILRRCGLDVMTVSIAGPRLIHGAHGIPIMADERFLKSKILNDCQGMIFPGGMPGAKNLMLHDRLKKVIEVHKERKTLMAAICAAPMILGKYGVLVGKKATCYPGFESHLKGALHIDAPVVVDGNIITGKGPFASVDFAFAIAAHFVPNKKIEAIRKDMFYTV